MNESLVTKTRDKTAALKFIKKAMTRHGRPKAIVSRQIYKKRRAAALDAWRAVMA